jgi:hypothetical protein
MYHSWEMKTAYKILTGNPEKKISPALTRHRWDIKMDLTETDKRLWSALMWFRT